jgi:hypothetical protein
MPRGLPRGVSLIETRYEGGHVMVYRRSLIAVIICVSAWLGYGCTALVVGGAAGAGAVAYVRGELTAVEDVSLDQAWSAAKQAMSDLEFSVTSAEKDAFDGKLIARGASDKKIVVKLERQSDAVTEIRIRVGTFGDEAMSREILEKIKKRF